MNMEFERRIDSCMKDYIKIVESKRKEYDLI